MGCVHAKKIISVQNCCDSNLLGQEENNLINDANRSALSNNQSRLIKCFTHKKSHIGSQLKDSENLEEMLLNEYIKKKETKDGKGKNSNINLMENEMIATTAELINQDRQLIRLSLLNHFLFKDLPLDIIETVMTNFILLQINSNDVLFKKGDNGNFFYIIKKGKLQLTIPGFGNKIVTKGDTFGELSLIQKNKRSGSVICIDDAEIFCLEGSIFRDIIQKLNRIDLKERIYFLNFIPIFKGLSNIELNNVARHMIKCEYGEGHFIIKEGEQGESLFIIKEGVISCIKSGKVLRRMYSKDFFGESSILFDMKRSLSIITMFKTVCYQISKSVLQETLGVYFKNRLLKGICKESFANSKYMKHLLIEDVFSNDIYPTFDVTFYQASQVIIPDVHYENRKLCVIVEGNIGDSNNKEIIATRGDLYGDIHLTSSEPLPDDIVALTDCIILESEWLNIIQAMNLNIESKKILSFFIRLSHLKKCQIFKNISEQRLMDICRIMKKQKYKNRDVIIQDGSIGNGLKLLYKGKAKVYKDEKFLRELEEGSCFGEVALLLNQPHSATVIASENIAIYSLSREDFNAYFDRNMYEFLLYKISLLDNFSTKLENIYFIKKLGEGKFGKVSLVHNEINIYAIKAVNRKAVEKQKKLIKYLHKERKILLSLDHPFIVKLVKTLKNEDYIFFLMEYVNGIEMRKYLDNRDTKKLKNIYETQFYTASLLLTINYLHNKKILHRDIKPDNIMIDEKGYIKLIDFGTSITINGFTTTITGTPHYMSPEVVLGKGYSYSADYWSIGVTVFELYFNDYPFGNNHSDPIAIYTEIIEKDLSFLKENIVENFISSLLKKNVYERECQFDSLKSSSFFHDFNWNELIDFRLTAPYIPDSVDPPTTLKKNRKNYLEELSKTKIKNLILSDYESDFENEYDPNWIDEF